MLQKRYIILAALGLGVASLSSCGKKFLDRKPIALTTEENFYKTESDIDAAVIAAYDPLNWNTDPTTGVYCNDYFYGDVASDDSKKGSSEGDLGDINAFDRFYLNPLNQQIKNTWRNGYRGVYLSNLVIANVDKVNAAQSVKDNVKGQALFLRAYYHFKLSNIYGDIPYVTSILSAEGSKLGKTPRATVLSSIAADLSTAAGLLPNRLATKEGRVTKGAALALLMRVALFQKDYSKVLSAFDQFEANNNGAYGLEANFADVFSMAKKNGKESIFSIQAMDVDNGDVDNFARRYEGMLFSTMCAPRGSYGGWGFNRPNKNLLDAFLLEKDKGGKDDPRLKATIIRNGDTIGPKSAKPSVINIPVEDSTGYPYGRYYTRKYILDQEDFDKKTNFLSTPMNFIAIRYADVLLMAAEAYNENGDNTNALKYLNKVRSRANMVDVALTDKIQLRHKIWDERRLELAMEGLRFFDLVRQDDVEAGRMATILKATGDKEGLNFDDTKHKVFPIPQDQIDLSEGALTQNPKY